MLSFSLLCKQLFIQLINRKAWVESLLSRNRGTKMFEREQYLTPKQQKIFNFQTLIITILRFRVIPSTAQNKIRKKLQTSLGVTDNGEGEGEIKLSATAVLYTPG